MARSFPPHFRPDSFGGPRAGHFSKREDAFQQLVGDALREEWGSNAFVAPTEGRDGSIDAAVNLATDTFVHGVPAPVILECKDHDDQLPQVADNIIAGWYKVRAKLRDQAKNGWPGMFRPWKTARGYVYCISAALPDENTRQRLQLKIEKFFRNLPADQRPPIEKVQVIGWPTIRDWLDRFPRLADRWLGVGLPALVGHEEHIGSLQGFRELLLDEKLSFVAPLAEAPYHPDRVLERAIALANQKGVLLIGPGGVGKTRTLMEVGARADAAGWRVLHALPDEPALTPDQLADVVLQGNASTVVLIDYLDQMHLDLGSLRRRLLPEMQKRGAKLALIADARPAFEARAAADWQDLFVTVELRPSDAHARQISAHVQATIAPKAIKILGANQVSFLCGSRPTIALLIAKELERRAHEGTLTRELIVDVRPGDLIAWLRKRLSEDDLVVAPSSSVLRAAQPTEELIAAAAVLAAAPQRLDELLAVAQKVFASGNASDVVIPSRYLMNALLNLGWLELRQRELWVAHDLVADEVLEGAVRVPTAKVIRHEVLRRILNASVDAPRTLGRYSVSLSRVLGHFAAEAQTDLTQSLQQSAAEWFAEAAGALGRGLLAVDPDESSYAMGAVLAGAPWGEAFVGSWQEVAQPWLERHQTTREARHLLYRGLRALKGHAAKTLVNITNRWLEEHGRQIEATFPLRPLLLRADLEPEAAQTAIEHALNWLGVNGHVPETQFVAYSLLARADLTPSAVETATACAVKWLRTYGMAFEARFVLRSLLERDDLDDVSKRAATDYALKWLRTHGLTLEAQYVLNSLLTHTAAESEPAQKAIEFAMSWLATANGVAPEAHFVFAPLLERTDLEAVVGPAALKKGLAWLAEHELLLDAEYVLHSLLARKDLDPTSAQASIAHAMRWLSKHRPAVDAEFVIRLLLDREDVETATDKKVIEDGVSWLAIPGHCARLDSSFLLGSLLDRTDLNIEQAAAVISHAVVWLETDAYHADATADYVLGRLLRRKDLDAGSAKKAMAWTLAWLDAGDRCARADADFLIGSLLSRNELNLRGSRKAVQYAFTWLSTAEHRLSAGASFVLDAVLARTDLEPAIQARATEEALAWMESHAALPEASFLLQRCLKTRSLPQDQIDRLGRAMYTWTVANADHPDMTYVINAFLRHPRSTDLLPHAIAIALTWLRANRTRQDRDFTLNSLLMHWQLLSTDELQQVVSDSFAWLRERRRTPDTMRNILQHLKYSTVNTPTASEVDRFADRYGIPLDDSPSRKPFRELTSELEALAKATDQPVPLDILRDALDATRLKVKTGASAAAGWALPALLPLTARCGDDTLFEETKTLTATVLLEITDWQRSGLAHACRRLIDAGAWPDVGAGCSTLESLGLHVVV